MQFTLATIIGLSATTLAAVIPRSIYGSWEVSVSKSAFANGFNSLEVVATYSSDTVEAQTSTCKYVFNPTEEPKESSSCDNDTFSYTYENDVISLKQAVQLEELTTVYGSAPLTLVSDAVGRTSTGSATVNVTQAVA